MEGKRPSFGNIGNFLKKFKNFTPSDTKIREVTARVLNERFGTKILKADIKIQHGTAFVRCSNTVKQEIRFTKASLLADINKELPENRIKDLV